MSDKSPQEFVEKKETHLHDYDWGWVTTTFFAILLIIIIASYVVKLYCPIASQAIISNTEERKLMSTIMDEAPNLRLVAWHYDSKAKLINGVVINSNKTSVKNVNISFCIFDKSNHQIGWISTTLPELKPLNNWNYTLLVRDDAVTYIKFDKLLAE